MSAVLPQLEEQLADATRRRAAGKAGAAGAARSPRPGGRPAGAADAARSPHPGERVAGATGAAPPPRPGGHPAGAAGAARSPRPGGRPARRVGRRRVAALAAVLAVAIVAAVALLPGRGGRLPEDLAARAYAAATRPGLVHWRIDLDGYVNGRFATRQRIEGWRLGDVTHTVHSDVVHGKEHVTADVRVSGRRSRAWMSVSDDYVNTTLPRGHHQPLAPIPSGDPLASFREAYRAGRLHPLGGGRFDLRFPHIPAGTMTYVVDPATGRPRTLTLTSPPRTIGTRRITSKTVVRFTAYEMLTPTAAHRAQLALRPHPGAGPGTTPARDLFAALRTGTAPSGATGGQLRSMAGHMKRFGVDPGGIRAVAKNVWLAPGRGYVCLYVAVPPAFGVGGTCTTTTVAARRGLSVSMGGPAPASKTPGAQPELHTILVVPDDVRGVRLKSGRTLTPVRGLVRLPPRTYNPHLIR